MYYHEKKFINQYLTTLIILCILNKKGVIKMMMKTEVSIFYYIQDNKLLDEKDLDIFDSKMDSVMRGLINVGVYVKNFQDRIKFSI